jgi:hypothetical protein
LSPFLDKSDLGGTSCLASLGVIVIVDGKRLLYYLCMGE